VGGRSGSAQSRKVRKGRKVKKGFRLCVSWRLCDSAWVVLIFSHVPSRGITAHREALSHEVATEDMQSSRQLCRPSRGFSGASALLFPHGCRRGPHSCARRGGLRNQVEPILAPMGGRGRGAHTGLRPPKTTPSTGICSDPQRKRSPPAPGPAISDIFCRHRPAWRRRHPQFSVLSYFGRSAVRRLTDGSSAGWKPALLSKLGQYSIFSLTGMYRCIIVRSVITSSSQQWDL